VNVATGEILEYGAFLSVKVQDSAQFDRCIAGVRTYYSNDYRLEGASEMHFIHNLFFVFDLAVSYFLDRNDNSFFSG